jgi:hypothetical protein
MTRFEVTVKETQSKRIDERVGEREGRKSKKLIEATQGGTCADARAAEREEASSFNNIP